VWASELRRRHSYLRNECCCPDLQENKEYPAILQRQNKHWTELVIVSGANLVLTDEVE